jgi:hypothetical protein
MRDIQTGPWASAEHKAILAAHRALCGTWPNQTPEQVAHAAQTTGKRLHRSWPVRNQFECPQCGIRWES